MLKDKNLLNDDLVFVGDFVTSKGDKIQAWIEGFGAGAVMKFERIAPDGSQSDFPPDITVKMAKAGN